MLSNINKRMTGILKALTEANDYITSHTLAYELGVTPKTIHTDIKQLKSLMNYENIDIKSKRGLGYKINCDSLDKVKSLLIEMNKLHYATDLNLITSDERAKFIIKELLYANKCITIEYMINELFVSESTIKNDLQIAKTILNKYNIKLEKTNEGLYADGHEVNKRFCISNYLIYGSKLEGISVINLFEYQNHDSAFDIRKVKSIILQQFKDEAMHISDDVLTKITVHIFIAMERINTNQYVSFKEEGLEYLRHEIEYNISRKIVNAIKKTFGTSFSEEETAYITLHIIGNRLTYKNNKTDFNSSTFLGEDIYQIAIQILYEISDWLNINYLKKDQALIYDLGLHLKQLLHRLTFKMNIRNLLLNKIKIKYPLAFEAGVIAAKVISRITGYKVNENEIGFLALHIAAAIERNQVYQSEQKRKVALVCASGVATSGLLLTKLSYELNSEYFVMGAYALHQIDELIEQSPDVILTTIKIDKELDLPIIEIDPVINDMDINYIKKHLTQIDNENITFSQLLKEDLFFPGLTNKTKQATLETLMNYMVQKGYIDENIRESVFSRENLSPTAIGNRVAIPHPVDINISNSCICIGILDKPIKWSDTEQVSIVFIVVLSDELKPEFQTIFSEFYDIVHSLEQMDRLKRRKNYDDFLSAIDINLEGRITNEY